MNQFRELTSQLACETLPLLGTIRVTSEGIV
jgi:hypothetical protein